MKNYRFTSDDCNKIVLLVKIAKSIKNLYNNLSILEENGNKDSKDYQQNLNYLKIVSEIEEEKYSNFDKDIIKCIAYINFLNKNFNISKYNILESTIRKGNDKLIERRIYNNLLDKIIDNYNLVKDYLNFDVTDLFNIIEEDVFINEKKDDSISVVNALNIDTLQSYLYFLDDKINSKMFSSIRSKLISSKYNTLFVNKNLEQRVINNNFNVDNELYISSKLIADVKGIKSNYYELLIENYLLNNVEEQILELLEMGNINYVDSDKVKESVLRECFIKSLLLLLDNDLIEDTMEDFLDNYENSNEQLTDNDISKEIINCCFNNIEKDKNKINILSLKPIKK